MALNDEAIFEGLADSLVNSAVAVSSNEEAHCGGRELIFSPW